MLRPRALREGDLVAIVATSGGLDKDECPARTRCRDARTDGVRRPALAVGGSRPELVVGAAPPTEVAEELNRHLRDPEVRALFSLTGGRMTLSYRI